MHPTKLFHTHDPEHLCALMEAHPFCLITSVLSGRPVAAHTPVLVNPADDEPPTLRFHLANANPVTQALKIGAPGLIIATGPHAYISPDWYGLGPDQVPTWNYLSAEAEGEPGLLSPAETKKFLADLSEFFEADLAPKQPWALEKMSRDKLDMLMSGITAFRLIPDRFEGVVKLNQNKPKSARETVADQLEDAALARWMRDI
ncbi:MAG: FMN-binding negative transcriptional regulator [Pseudomonadota bacterium]